MYICNSYVYKQCTDMYICISYVYIHCTDMYISSSYVYIHCTDMYISSSYVFLMHPDLQLHFKIPCPVPIDCSLAAYRTLISVSKSTEPRCKVLDVHGRNWFLENDPFKRPFLVASLYCCVSVLISVRTHIRFL